MVRNTMKIQKSEAILIGICSIAGFVLLLFPANSNLTEAICVAPPSGALGGCIAALFNRFVKNHQKRKNIQKALESSIENFADVQIALDRLRDQKDPVVSSHELRKTLGL